MFRYEIPLFKGLEMNISVASMGIVRPGVVDGSESFDFPGSKTAALLLP